MTPSLSLQAHKALLLPLLPSLLPLLCSSCSPHDPLVLLLPHTSSTSLAWALESLYLQGDSTLLARELGLQVDTIEGIQTGEEDPLDVMDEFGQENIVKNKKLKTAKVKTSNNENRKVMQPEVDLVEQNKGWKNSKDIPYDRVSHNQYSLSLSEALHQESLMTFENSDGDLYSKAGAAKKRDKWKMCH